MDGSFKGGGFRWKKAGREKEGLRFARMVERERKGMRGERNEGTKKKKKDGRPFFLEKYSRVEARISDKGDEEPLIVGIGWEVHFGAREMEEKQKDEGEEDMGAARNLGKKKGRRIRVGRTWQVGRLQNREDWERRKREQDEGDGKLLRVGQRVGMEIRKLEEKEKENRRGVLCVVTGSGARRSKKKKERKVRMKEGGGPYPWGWQGLVHLRRTKKVQEKKGRWWKNLGVHGVARKN